MKTIIEMAREAGLVGGPVYAKGLEKFAALVRADEREACAKLCEAEWSTFPEQRHGYDLAAAIRARGDT